MEAAELKVDLHEKIEHADAVQLQEIYGLLTNYFNGNESTEEWDSLSEAQKNRTIQSLELEDAGLGESLIEVNKR
jgi:hypothetical protein